MILAGSGIHARPDSRVFNIELQRLADTVRSNVKQNSDEGIVSTVQTPPHCVDCMTDLDRRFTFGS